MDLGLIGVPQAGKSTVLGLLAGGPVTGRVAVAQVPDRRLEALAAVFHPRKVTPASIRLTELDGVRPERLDRGARNAFFEGVRRADALVHVVRAFDDPAVPHPAGEVDPLRDARAVEEELLLADLERAEGLAERLEKNRSRGREEDRQLEALRACAAGLGEGRPVRALGLGAEALRALAGFGLLTARQELLALNLDDTGLRAAVGGGAGEAGAAGALAALEAWAREQHVRVVPFSAKVEAEIAALPPGERADFLAAYGLDEPGTDRLARAAYAALGLVSFLTAGEDEVRAWPIPAGTTARRAAGKVHSDIERGFIRAEVARVEDVQAVGDWKALRDRGLMRLEGADYVMQDGDVVNFRFHV